MIFNPFLLLKLISKNTWFVMVLAQKWVSTIFHCHDFWIKNPANEILRTTVNRDLKIAATDIQPRRGC